MSPVTKLADKNLFGSRTIYSSMLAGNDTFVLPPLTSFDLLETQVLTGSAASVTFSSLSTYAADYQHLQIRGVVRDTNTGFSLRNGVMTFNSDTTTYYTHYLEGNGSSVSSGVISTSVQGYPFIYTGSATTTVFSPFVMDILDPFETTKNTTVRTLSGVAGENITLRSFGYFDTQAVGSMTIFATGASFAIGSRFSLYGIRG